MTYTDQRTPQLEQVLASVGIDLIPDGWQMSWRASQAVDPAETFAARHTLQTTLVGPELRLAVVDGQVVRVGDTFDGFRLVKLGYRKAVLESNGVEVVLKLKAQPQDR